MLYVAIVKPELCSDMFHEWDVAHVLRSTSYTRGVYNVTMYTQNSTAVGYGQQKVSPFTTTVERRVDNCSAAGHVRDCDCDYNEVQIDMLCGCKHTKYIRHFEASENGTDVGWDNGLLDK